MDYSLPVYILISACSSVVVTYAFVRRRFGKKIKNFSSLERDIEERIARKSELNTQLIEANESLKNIKSETAELRQLKDSEGALIEAVKCLKEEHGEISQNIENARIQLSNIKSEMSELVPQLDLYSRLEDFVSYGHFETPDYLFETTERFEEEIRRVRDQQKKLISSNRAVEIPDTIKLSQDEAQNKKILKGQSQLLLAAFNIECDFLIGKVSPSRFSRSLEQIENLANKLEKNMLSLKCGITDAYMKLKFEECRLFYQYKLKKQEEQEEQRLIREQIREEQKAIREYEAAIAKAEQEEKIYREMLEKAREELLLLGDEQKAAAESRIKELEEKLLEAEASERRAKSLAEQTRKGHVYIISNIGSFGENVYKIGLTRRLDPMDRVKELGDASVPFPFDVHAIIYYDDAPALEAALHREFSHSRVNAVNLRKEFFRVDLEKIRAATNKLTEKEAEFRTTIVAEEYYETKRLQEAHPA
ncbi:DUF4041 domain-containing protein [Thalassospira tepidiphila]|uniref:DUF4041 domain-containing protein n=1 Tax=Thalassospira tepidiphila TaxID=393657 RepID=UPI003AA8C60E